jgi:hypothetical protein
MSGPSASSATAVVQFTTARPLDGVRHASSVAGTAWPAIEQKAMSTEVDRLAALPAESGSPMTSTVRPAYWNASISADPSRHRRAGLPPVQTAVGEAGGRAAGATGTSCPSYQGGTQDLLRDLPAGSGQVSGAGDGTHRSDAPPAA